MAIDKRTQRPEAGDANTPDNPVHTGVTKDTASTPGYFRLFMPGLAARYVFRYLVNTEKEAGFLGVSKQTQQEAQKIIHSVKHHTDSTAFNEGVELLKKWNYKGHFDSAEDAMHKAAYHRQASIDLNAQLTAQETTAGRSVKVERLQKDQLIATLENRTLTTDIATAAIHHDRWETFKSDVMKTARDHDKTTRTKAFERYYDYALGLGSTLLTMYYAWRVSSDIKKVFAETVSYEHGKEPSQLSVKDFWNSDNVLVQSTVNNYMKKNAVRLGTDTVFFFGPLLHVTGLSKIPGIARIAGLPFSDLGVGIKGGQLLMEIQNKEMTTFEYLLNMIDSKLNPTRGIGDHIKPSEIIDLYQKWASIKDPKAGFRDATIYQDHDGMSWAKSEVIFTRVTDLLNGTYKYKHPDNNLPVDETAPNFALPKFLYLLGHNMIDTYKPEQTLAYVEVANRFGIEGVKNMKEMLERGVGLEQVMEKYPVDITILKSPRENAAVVPEPVTETHRSPASVPISFFPPREASMAHSNENIAPLADYAAEHPTTHIASSVDQGKIAVDTLKEAER